MAYDGWFNFNRESTILVINYGMVDSLLIETINHVCQPIVKPIRCGDSHLEIALVEHIG